MTRKTAAAWLLWATTAAAQAPGGVPLSAGDTIQFDLSGLPRSYEGTGKATCKGTVVTAVGLEERTCERTYRFQVPSDAAKLTYVFRPRAGRERSIDLPLLREERPVTFTAPEAGALLAPKPLAIPEAAADGAAREAARSECARCEGRGFELVEAVVTEPPRPVGGAPQVRLKLTKAPPPAPPR